MRRLLPNEKNLYHLQEYAIVQKDDTNYEYVAWEADKQTDELSWIRGIAVVVEDILCLAMINADGKEEEMDSMLELNYELGQLPEWDKTKYYCVVVAASLASLAKYCGTGNPLKPGSQEFKKVQEMLERNGIVPPEE